MAFSPIRRPQAALAMGVAALALASVSAGAAHASAFGTNSEVALYWQSLDSDGVHQLPGFDCVITPSVCGAGARSAATSLASTNVNTLQGFITGSVTAMNTPPPQRYRSSVSANGLWWDTLTVDGAGLDAGTIVDVRLMVNLQVNDYVASIAAPPPYTEVRASLNAGADTAEDIFYSDGSAFSTAIFRATIDTPFEVLGRFRAQTSVNESPVDLGSGFGVANYYIDVVGIEPANTFSAMRFSAANSFDSLPRLITASGHDYSFNPASSGAPEPATWTMLIMGFGLAGALARRRRAVAA